MPVAEVKLDEGDLMDSHWFVDRPPHELFGRMRSEAFAGLACLGTPTAASGR
jgi:hypothetical protein